MASGDTKTNQYLDIAANGTRADLPTDTCCETRTQTLIRGVAERIMDVEDEVEEIKNNPDVVDIVDTYADLQAYSTSGLTDKDVIRVITDETKGGLSSYYRWNSPDPGWNFVGVIPGGDGIKELSSADYNYPTANPDRVALWLLDNGLYTAPAGVMVAASTTSYPWYNTSDKTILVGGSNTVKGIYTFLNGKTDVVTTQVSDGTEADEYTLLKSTQVLQTTGQSTTDTMSQKAITDAIADGGGGTPRTGRNLTNEYTIDELSAKVTSGDFSGLHVGDYITKTVKVGSNTEQELDFVIADFDYFLGMGDTEFTTHHLVMVPDTAFSETMKMNDTNTTAGGYYGSQAHGIATPAYTAGTGGALTNVVVDYEMFLHSTLEPTDGTYTFTRNSSGKWELNSEDVGAVLNEYGITYSGTPVAGDTIVVTFAKGYLEPYRQAIYAAFGEDHILNYRSYMSTSTSGGTWHNARVELMNESMVYGQIIRANNVIGDMFAKSPLALFRNEPYRVVTRRGKGGPRSYTWLSSISGSSNFCVIYTGGYAYNYGAGAAYAVRPYFLFA